MHRDHLSSDALQASRRGDFGIGQRLLDVVATNPARDEGSGVERRIDALAEGNEVVGLGGQRARVAGWHVEELVVVMVAVGEPAREAAAAIDEHDAAGLRALAQQVHRGQRTAVAAADDDGGRGFGGMVTIGHGSLPRQCRERDCRVMGRRARPVTG